jgi:hypothetical protein
LYGHPDGVWVAELLDERGRRGARVVANKRPQGGSDRVACRALLTSRAPARHLKNPVAVSESSPR